MQSCVRYRGHVSDWFEVTQGKRVTLIKIKTVFRNILVQLVLECLLSKLHYIDHYIY